MWMKIARPSMSSASTLANPIFKLMRALNYCMNLGCNHINQQKVLDTRFVRSLSCGTASWKPTGTKSDDAATNNQNRKDGRKEQGKGRKFFRSRTPWLGKGLSRQLPMSIKHSNCHTHSTCTRFLGSILKGEHIWCIYRSLFG